MSKHLRNIIIVLYIVTFFTTLYLLGKIIYMHFNEKDAIDNARFNTDKCDEKMCKSISPVPPVPNNIDLIDWRVDIAKYSAELLYRIDEGVQNKEAIEYLPEITVLKELYNDTKDPIFGSIMENNGVIWIGLRGTLTDLEWEHGLDLQQETYLESQSATQVEFDISNSKPLVHKGFMNVYKNIKTDIMDTLEKHNQSKDKPVIVTGHGIGGAVSTIAGFDLVHNNYSAVVYNYASPRIGNQLMADMINNSINVFRVVNTTDIVPNMPESVTANFDDVDKPLIYVHCGMLKTFTDNWLSTLNNHLIPIYMNGLETL